jgi:hypothetical protein
MLAFPAGLRIFLAVEAVDMRKQYTGLWAYAVETPDDGIVFLTNVASRSSRTA